MPSPAEKLYIVFEGNHPLGSFLACFEDILAAQRLQAARSKRYPCYIVPYVISPEYEAQKAYEANTPRG